jgi:triosephosphate isomerase
MQSSHGQERAVARDEKHPKPLIAGNWKMNGLKASIAELLKVIEGCDASLGDRADLLVCPPATLIAAFSDTARGSHVLVGAQDCHAKASGAHTGNISAEMIADAGGAAVIVGHSERRAEHGETDAMVKAKAEAANRAGLFAIVCVGETEAERNAGHTLDVVSRQLAGSLPGRASAAATVVAYEPVWAIGTGRTATPVDIEEVHRTIRAQLVETLGPEEGRAVRILYGGSVKPDNAAEILAVPNVNGALVGGASLKAADFLAIARAAP